MLASMHMRPRRSFRFRPGPAPLSYLTAGALAVAFSAPPPAQAEGGHLVLESRDPQVKITADGFETPSTDDAYVWTSRRAYSIRNLKDTILEAEVFVPSPDQEIIVAFSQNRRRQGEPHADALTLGALVSDWTLEIGGRAGSVEYESYHWAPPDEEDHRDRQPRWHKVQVRFSPRIVSMRIDGYDIGVADPTAMEYPSEGYVGFVVIGEDGRPGHKVRVKNVTVREEETAPYLLGADFDLMSHASLLYPDGVTNKSSETGYVWTRQPAYDFDEHERIELSFEAEVFAEKDEIIVAFSENRLFWGELDPTTKLPLADALTFSLTTEADSVRVRTGMFQHDLEVRSSSRNLLPIPAREWIPIAATLSKDRLVVKVRGREVANVSLTGKTLSGGPIEVPRRGHVGFIQYARPDASEADEVVFRNVRINRVKPATRSSGETVVVMRSTVPAAMPTHALTQMMGQTHALLIGVSKYQSRGIATLRYPVRDAEKLRDTLTKYYRIDPSRVRVVRNPSRGQIYQEFNALKKRVKPNDSVLIFYAGHGQQSKERGQGYWLPADATPSDDSGTWISNSDIKNLVKAVPSKHTLIISDACFGGTLVMGVRAINAGADLDAAHLELWKQRSRKAMTSGAAQTVPDKSVFMEKLLERLEKTSKPFFTANALFNELSYSVMNNSEPPQTPTYGPLTMADDTQVGQFIFVRR